MLKRPAAWVRPLRTWRWTALTVQSEEAQSVPSVLLIDDDRSTRETIAHGFRFHGIRLGAASCAADGFMLASAANFDVIAIDYRLPDLLGIDLARCVRAVRPLVPFVVMSAWMTADVESEALRLGAIRVLEKPLDLADLVRVVHETADRHPLFLTDAHREDRLALIPAGWQPHSVPERWASFVLRGCEAPRDPACTAEWAREAGTNPTGVKDTCSMLGISTRGSRDLTRLLRALIWSALDCSRIETKLQISDPRTQRRLLTDGALEPGRNCGLSIGEFLARQQFVNVQSEAVQALAKLLRQLPTGPTHTSKPH